MFMNQVGLIILWALFALSAHAQTSRFACGTAHSEMDQIKSRLLKNKNDLLRDPIQLRSTQYIPIKFFIVANDDGSGGVEYRNILDQLCTLNEDFLDIGIQFYLKDGFTVVNDSRINEDHYHNSLGMEMLRDSAAINVWIVKTPYSPFPDAITQGLYQVSKDWLVIRREEINRLSYTLTHELGHFFSLLHTFYGWDIDPWTAERHGNPAPVMAPMNVATEYQNGSNCESAGDYICDTPPDYNFGYYWTSNCNYGGGAKDPMGVIVDPDESNFMTYFDRCDRSVYHFSEGQRYVMQADLMSNSRHYIRSGYTPSCTQITDHVELLSPASGEQPPYYNQIRLEWTEARGASHYLVEIDRIPSFSLKPLTYIANANSLEISDLEPGRSYYWRVRPFSEYVTCNSASPIKQFKTGSLATAVNNIRHLSDWNVHPNPVLRNSGTEIAFNSLEAFNAEVNLYSIAGQLVRPIGTYHFVAGRNRFHVATQGLDAGIYFLSVRTSNGKQTEKIIIQ